MPKKRKKKREKRSTQSAARRRAEEHGAGFEITSLILPEGVTLFKLKSEKSVRLDILPYIVGKHNPWADEGESYYERTYFVHRGIGADNNSYVCLRKELKKPCPICEHRAKLMKDPDADEDTIKNLAPKERQLFNIIDLRDKEKGVQIWDIAWWLFGKRLEAAIRNGDEDEYDNFFELENGYTLKLGVEEGRFGGRAFYGIESVNFKSREDYDEDILEEVHCLDDVIKITPYDELKKILLQTEEEDEDKKSKSKSKKKKQQDDEFEDDEDEDVFEDDDEDDEDEDEDEFEDEFEDDDEDEFEDDDEDEDEDEFEDDDEDEFEDDDEDEDEDEVPKKSKKNKSTKKKSSKKKKGKTTKKKKTTTKKTSKKKKKRRR